MSYRKDKKFLTKMLRKALDHQDEHPLSNSAKGNVKYYQFALAELKRLRKQK